MKVVTTGRIDLDDYFALSGVLEFKKLKHTPFIVFLEGTDSVEIKIVDNKNELLSYPGNTKVMGQWRGQWSSDFFKFKISDVIDYIRMKGGKKE